MKKFLRLHTCFLICFALTGLTFCLRSAALLFAFDREIGYFANGALPVLFNVIAALSLLFFALTAFCLPAKELGEPAPQKSDALRAAAGAVALLLVADLILLFTTGQYQRAKSFLIVLTVPALLLACAYFLPIALGKTLRGSAMALPGCGGIFAGALLISLLYFDRYTPMNAPRKVGVQLALLSFMLALLYELRAKTGIPLPRMAVFSTLLSFFLCVVIGLSDIVAFAAGVYRVPFYFMQDLLLLASGIYFLLSGPRPLGQKTGKDQTT